jgi:PAS domain S-box-containing protein
LSHSLGLAADGDGGLSVLWEDGERVFCRVWRQGDNGDRTAMLAVIPASDDPGPGYVGRLAHEYRLRSHLDPHWAVRPVALTQHHDRPALLLDDSAGLPLRGLIAPSLDLAPFLRMAIALARVCGQMHEHGVIHKDIKPANVLVYPADGTVRLTGFGIASRLARERQPPAPPQIIAGTLAYMAPEQTGRMNRSIDARSDLYSLGVTLYEMLTGTLPFTAADPMEWIHCHIARSPMPPSERVKGIPPQIDAIVLKLLAKTAEDRYQSAAGVAADLKRCLASWETGQRIDRFPVGANDAQNRLLIPEKLYGRAAEIDTLVAAFERVVAQGKTELVLISGYSGVGKSSVVSELHRAIVPPRGLFAAGKFDQYKRHVPYATLAEAFQSLVRYVLRATDAEVSRWRDALQEALGANGQLMTGLIPELEFVIGKQPPLVELPPQEAQSRFQMVFRRFLGVFARREHPLVLFLDDLQWLDPATLALLEDYTAHADSCALLLVGAYRDNEVDASHPLMRSLGAIRKTGTPLHEIVLAPLRSGDVERLVADALCCGRERARSLAELVYEKAGGNPFFVIQFLTALDEEKLLHFDAGAGMWIADIERIRGKGYTDNVVDLVVRKLERLSPSTRQVLERLACLGNVVKIATLELVKEQSAEALLAALSEAVQAGLVFRSEDAYAFLHDRVREAAYSLIPEDKRAATHLRIGRALAAKMSQTEIAEQIFDVVSQLNRGSALVQSLEERERVAELNLVAGRRAKSATAYASAASYLAAGRDLMPEDCWERRYDLVFALEITRAECELLTGNSDAEARLAMLTERARNLTDLAAVASLREVLYTTLNQFDRSIEVALGYLRNVGVSWPAQPTQHEVLAEYEAMLKRLRHRSIPEMAALPLMSDPTASAMVEVLTEIVPAAYFTNIDLCCLVVCRIANLSFEYGNSNGSVYAYSLLGFLLRTRFGNHAGGFQFGKLALDLAGRRELNRFRARVYLNFAYCVNPWSNNIRTGRALLRQGLTAAEESGDPTFAAYLHYCLMTDLIASGDPLDHVQREGESGLEFVANAKFGLVVDIMTGHLRFVRTMRGMTASFGSFSDAAFDEGQFEEHLDADPGLANPTCVYWIRKMQARFFAGDYAAALHAATKAGPLLWTSPASFETADYHFYAALTRAAHCDIADDEERGRDAAALSDHRRQIEQWAEHCPANFEDRAALVAAETARLEGRDLEAMRLYEHAIRSARENGFVQNEGLANERAAAFYAARGFPTSADAHLRHARSCYGRWGAEGKVRQLDKIHALLGQEPPRSDGTVATPVDRLDLATVVKVSQAITSEMDLDKLVNTLMIVALEHAGADRGVLILPRGEQLWIEAEASTLRDAVDVQLRQAPAGSGELAVSILRYVLRTHESVLLDDIRQQNPYSADEYVRQNHCRSMLCVPLIKQARLIGMLYLEHRQASHVFTPERFGVLKLLASQAAISLENARLYADLQEREARIRRLVDANIVGIFLWSVDGRIIESNDAFLRTVGYDRDDLVAGRMHWTELTPPEWNDRDRRAVEEVAATGTAQPYEKEYFRKDGSRVPVLIGGAMFEPGTAQGVAYVLDLSERKRAEAGARESERRYREIQTELAHANRVATMGQLTASIAHEVRQPITAAVTNAHAALRWLGGEPADFAEAQQALARIVNDGNRASDVIERIRALIKKAPRRQDRVDINDAIRAIVGLTRGEALKNDVSVRVELADGLPAIEGDRVELQQVIMNLIINAVEAMSGASKGPRELLVMTERGAEGGVLVTIKDSGPGVDPESLQRIFDPFYTTKSSGLGLGLSICRSIIEAHHGRLWAEANLPRGTTFHFAVQGDR